MSTITILSQPKKRSVVGGYEPILLEVLKSEDFLQASSLKIRCDVFIAGNHFDSLQNSSLIQVSLNQSKWTFDLMPTIQEYYKNNLGTFPPVNVYKTCFCKIREEACEFPDAGKSETPQNQPVLSNIFYVVNTCWGFVNNKKIQNNAS